MLIGYARVSTRLSQDPIHQTTQLETKGIDPQRIYVDHGYTGTNTRRPALREAMAALREGDTLVVTKLDRLARSVIDAHSLAAEIQAKGAKLQIGDSTHDPADPVGQLLFNVLAMIAQFERDLISMRTRDGLVQAKAKGKMNGRPPKLSKPAERAMLQMLDDDDRTATEVAEIFGVSRATLIRARRRATPTAEIAQR